MDHLDLLAGGRPILLPSFIGDTLSVHQRLSAYATAAPGGQGSPLVQLRLTTPSDRRSCSASIVAKAMALAMIVVVALVMTLYALLDRRASRWLVR